MSKNEGVAVVGTGAGGGSAVPAPAPIYEKPGAESVAELVKRIQADGAKGLLKEFHRLKAQSSKMEGLTEVASKANMQKHRYKDVGCWDQTRVKLEGEGGPGSDYIHANWVEGVEQSRRYILTQAPLLSIQGYDDTVADFWRMVWEQGVCVIIMLCQTVEQGKAKCAEYWPRAKGGAHIHGNFSVFCKEAGDRHIADHTIVLSNLILTRIDGAGEGRREVCHYLHSNWPDRKCPPSAAPIVDFLLKVKKAQKTLAERQGLSLQKSPILVHCSAGIGRTGTLVAVDIGMGLLARPSPRLSLPHIVYQLRRQRRFAVQTPIQYLCIYQGLLEFLLRTPIITNFNIAHFNREIAALAITQSPTIPSSNTNKEQNINESAANVVYRCRYLRRS